MTVTREQSLDRLKQAKIPVKLVTYAGSQSGTSTFCCTRCDTTFERSVSYLLNPTVKIGCPTCKRLRRRELGAINRGVAALTDARIRCAMAKHGLELNYTGKLSTATPLTLTCKQCSHVTVSTWGKHRGRHGCSQCKPFRLGGVARFRTTNGKAFRSRPERAMYRELVSIYGVDDVLTEDEITPIEFSVGGKRKRYWPDFYVKSIKQYVEVKSTYTLLMALPRNRSKYRVMRRRGLGITFVVADHVNARYVELPDNWDALSRHELKQGYRDETFLPF